MRRVPLLVALVAVAFVSLSLLLAARVPAVAQEGTPTGEEFAPEGVTFEPLGFGTAEDLPAAPADLVLLRFTIVPGADFPIEADDPSVALVFVDSGALTARVEAPIRVTRAATIALFATPGAVDEGAIPAPEEVAVGTEFTLAAGDSAVFPPNVEGEIRNDGTEPAVALVAIIAPPEGGAATPGVGTPVTVGDAAIEATPT